MKWVYIIGVILFALWIGIPYFLCKGLPSGSVITTTTGGQVTC